MTTNARIADADNTSQDEPDHALVSAEQNATPQHPATRLSRADSLRFAQALIDPPEPNERLRDALHVHRELIAD